MISVKDIREKEFGMQKHGYDEGEVDEFLDAIADQMEKLVRENYALLQKVEEAQKELAAAKETAVSAPETPAPAAPVETPAPVVQVVHKPVLIAEKPLYAPESSEEATYFRDLQATVRETLISAQRIADETVGEARKKSKLMLSAAEEQSNALKAQTKQEVEAAKLEVETLKASAEDYRKRFLRIVQDQMHTLKADETLFEK